MIRLFRNTGWLSGVFGLLLLLSGPVTADEPQQGQVAMVFPDDYQITVVDDQNNVHQVRLSVDGKVMINGQERSLSDLVGGERVTITYENVAGQQMATEIDANPRPE